MLSNSSKISFNSNQLVSSRNSSSPQENTIFNKSHWSYWQKSLNPSEIAYVSNPFKDFSSQTVLQYSFNNLLNPCKIKHRSGNEAHVYNFNIRKITGQHPGYWPLPILKTVVFSTWKHLIRWFLGAYVLSLSLIPYCQSWSWLSVAVVHARLLDSIPQHLS